MNITETDYNYIKVPEDATSIGSLPGRSWSGPIALPTPVRINNKVITHFNLSSYGAVRLSAAKDGQYHYFPGDTQLPESIFETQDGYMLVPWGELQRIKSCGGIDVKLFQVGNIVCLNYYTRSTYSDRKFMYQVQFDVTKSNQISVHYYHCVSGYNTYVGIVLDPADYKDWPIKANQPYMKKALLFDVAGITTEVVDLIEPEPEPQPLTWRTVYEGAGYRVQEGAK